MSIDVIIHGAGGRMGREIARIVLGDADLHLAGCLEQAGHPSVGQDIGLLAGVGNARVPVGDDPERLPLQTAVIIDFSAPGASLALLARLTSGRGIVIGTTGFTDRERATVETAAQRLPVLFSPNMSLGVNLLFYLTEQVARRLGRSFDVEIVEAHHRHKLDAPSGTARRLGEIAAGSLGLSYEKDTRHGRVGITGERTDHEIGMHALRGGDIVGDHTVLFAGDGERLELRHMAHSRATFGAGAVAAAKWLAGRPSALYSMRDVLGF